METFKANTSGSKAFIRMFIVYDTPGALPAGRALVDILDTDPAAGSKELVPMFLMVEEGREITLY